MHTAKIQRSVCAVMCIVIGMTGSMAAGATVTADEALRLLTEGNARFVTMQMQYPDETIERRESTAMNGQMPFAVVLACSDSRVPVEAIFDRGIGDIFVVRVAGNIVMDSGVVGSIEYGAEHLKAPLVVIMGHTGCGAVKAAVDNAVVEGKIRDIQKQISPVVAMTKSEHPDLAGPDLVNAVAKNNALQAKKDLVSLSHEIKEMADAGTVRVVTALYDIKTGKVTWTD